MPVYAEAPEEKPIDGHPGLSKLLVAVAAAAVAVLAMGPLQGAWRRHRQASLASVALPPELASAVAEWRKRFPQILARDEELIASGKVRLSDDRPKSYLLAAELFEQALVLNPRSVSAAAGYGEAVALGPRQSLGDGAYGRALALVQEARNREPQSLPAALAQGDLVLSRAAAGAQEEARVLAEKALTELGGEHSAEAHLLRGRANLANAHEMALHELDAAIRENEGLKRAYYFRGLARAALADYAAAVEDLQRRLAMDADCEEALFALGQIYQEVGAAPKARQAFAEAQKRHPEDVRPVLALAALHYQVEGKPQEAVALLKPWLHGQAQLDPQARRELWGHVVAALRQEGNRELPDMVRAARKEVPDAVEVDLQVLLSDISEGDASDASLDFERVRGKLKDTSLEQLLGGRVAFMRSDLAAASAAFAKALEENPGRLDAALWLALALAKAGQEKPAFEALQRASRMDPGMLRGAPNLHPDYLPPKELLRGAEREVAALSKGGKNLPITILEGAIRYSLRDLPGAQAALRRALKADERNALGLGYLALLQMDQGDTKGAEESARRALASDRELALGHYALGAVLTAKHRAEPAQKELAEAERLAPSLFLARMKLAELDATAHPDQAKARLIQVLGIDPGYAPAKSALFALEERR
jgi:Tfp pilus assembly protein PilF